MRAQQSPLEPHLDRRRALRDGAPAKRGRHDTVAAAGPAAAGAGADGDGLADSSEYMPAAMLPSANVRIRMGAAGALPAHRELLARHCGALDAGALPGFLEASPDAPVVVSEPFCGHAPADVLDFLGAVYADYADTRADAALTRLPVLRLAHALDARAILARGCALLLRAAPGMDLERAAEAAALAVLALEDALLAACQAHLAAPPPPPSAPPTRRISRRGALGSRGAGPGRRANRARPRGSRSRT